MQLPDQNPNRLRRRLLPLVVIGIAVLIFIALWMTRTPPPPKVVDEKAWPVSVETIQVALLAPSLQLYGRVETPTAADLASSLSADAMQVAVLEGDVVKSGQLLVRLDDADYRLRLEGDTAALKHEEELLGLARKAQQRAEQMYKDGLASSAQVDEASQVVAQRALAVAGRRTSLDAAKLNMERTRIVAPFAGRVSRVPVARGDRVSPGQTLVSLYDPSRLELRAPVPATYLARVQQALANGRLEARIVLDGGAINGQLIRLSGEARSGSSNIDGFFALDQARTDLEPGRTLEIVLHLPAEPGAVAIPFEALYGRDRVYVAQGDRMHAVVIEALGEFRPEGERPRLLVRSPELKDGMQLITTQLPLAIDGLKIRLPDESAPAAKQ